MAPHSITARRDGPWAAAEDGGSVLIAANEGIAVAAADWSLNHVTVVGIAAAAADWSLNARHDRIRRRHVTLASPCARTTTTGRIDGSLAAGG